MPLKNIPNHGELDMYYVSNSHEGIISRETFELTKRRMSQTTCERKTPQKHLFTGIIECESCGWAYKRKVQNGVVYWVCSRKKSAGYLCESKNISEENLKKAFVKMYNKLRRFETEILDRTYNQLLKLREKLSGQNNEVSQIDIEIADLCNKINMYTEFHLQGIIDDISFLERTSELKYRVTELRNKRTKLLYANEDEKVIEEIKILMDTLEEYPKVILSFDNSLFSSIVDKVIIGKTETITFKLKGGLCLDI